MTTGPTVEAASRYKELQEQAEGALHAGDLRQALELYEQSRAAARGLGDDELIDRSFCNCAAVRITLGELEEPLLELRRILMGNASGENCFLAAYNVARSYELRKEAKKGLFYARIARDRAQALGRPEWLYGAHNQIANFLVADSNFREGAGEYRTALAILPREKRTQRLEAQLNLGYCELMLGQEREGLRRLYSSLRLARRSGLGRLAMIAHLDLCFGLLERGRYDLAWRHGACGLAMAEATGDSDWIKNGLYLVGEVALLGGQTEAAYDRFAELQSRFYADQPFVTDFLMSVDVRPLINLRA